MSIMLAYDFPKISEVNKEVQEEIEWEIIKKLLCGMQQYQRLIIAHTCDKMFRNTELRNIYQLLIKHVNQYGIDRLNYNDVICYLRTEDEKYTPFLCCMNKDFTHSADTKNWILRLHKLWEKQLYSECRTSEDVKRAADELKKYVLIESSSSLKDEAVNYLCEYEDTEKGIIKTGYTSIDNSIGGFMKGNLILIAGATGMGKTAMLLNILLNIAKCKKRVLLFSLEMSAEELVNRIIASEIGINSASIRNRAMTENEIERYADYVNSDLFNKFQDNIEICNIPNLSEIEAKVMNSNADLIAIDYLGLIREKSKSNKYEEISEISRRIKSLAISAKVPIILLAQLNRNLRDRNDKRPILSDLKDSSQIEQDIDIGMFVYRPAYYDQTKDRNIFEVIFAKSRHSGAANNIIKLNFNGNTQKITETLT